MIMENAKWKLKMEITSLYFTRIAICKMQQRVDLQDFSELMVKIIFFKR
jgi:hypothetical protein